MARFVKVSGTGLNGSGIEKGPSTQITAVMTAVSVSFWVEKNGFLEEEVFSMVQSPFVYC